MYFAANSKFHGECCDADSTESCVVVSFSMWDLTLYQCECENLGFARIEVIYLMLTVRFDHLLYELISLGQLNLSFSLFLSFLDGPTKGKKQLSVTHMGIGGPI